MFLKPRKLPYGREIIRTENFSLIYLGSGNIHYSYVTSKRLFYGHFNIKRLHLTLIPFLAFSLSIFFYFFFTPDTNANVEELDFYNKEIQASLDKEDERDKEAKKGDESYLQKTEEQKKSILQRISETGTIRLKTYYVQPGETLEEIAARFRTDPQTIANHSKIKVDSVLKAGQALTVPEKQGILYKFKAGDTLAKVASIYKVSIEDVLMENNLEDVDFFSVGQKIFLPKAVLPEPPPIWYKPVASGIITSGFGWRTFPRFQFHEAWDLKANYEPVRAARAGTVIYSGWMGGYGNCIIIEHTPELKTLYAHNSKLFVKEGEYVQGGKVIARSGCTGYCFGAHLHFEIIRNGVSVDPKSYIKGFYPKSE
jgi:murein DD-endopeptidase MepM/ murein hydrolase activator NlpD